MGRDWNILISCISAREWDPHESSLLAHWGQMVCSATHFVSFCSFPACKYLFVVFLLRSVLFNRWWFFGAYCWRCLDTKRSRLLSKGIALLCADSQRHRNDPPLMAIGKAAAPNMQNPRTHGCLKKSVDENIRTSWNVLYSHAVLTWIL